MRFTKVSQDAFEQLQTDAGVLLNTFDPETPTVADAAIITATTGGITVTCQAEFEDWGEDIDNCPNNTKELKRITGWNCGLSTTALGTKPELIRIALGAADITASNGKITPRRQLASGDFADAVWWVGDRADGGMVAVKLINALSTDGFELQTTKNGKGQISLGITGHVSITAQDVVPMEFYVSEGEGA